MRWSDSGVNFTEMALKTAIDFAGKNKIVSFVISSNTGNTIYKFLDLISNENNFDIICVTHQFGFAGNGECEMAMDTRIDLQNKGVKVFTGTHLFRGIEKNFQVKYGGMYPLSIVADTLRLFGQGTKVAVEIAIMALDAGLIEFGEKVIAIGGTHRGVDTALLITPAHSNAFFDTKIHKIIYKPYE